MSTEDKKVHDKVLLQKLRDITGVGMMDCKKALTEANNDLEQAIDLLRKKGAAVASKRADKETSEGVVHAYIHPGSRLGVLIEINCETDFVARTDDFKQFTQDICLHIAALKPLYLNPEDIDPKFLEHEKSILKEQLTGSGKPEKIIDQILDGKVQKLYDEICLVRQPFIKNDQITVAERLNELIAKTGENIKIRRFVRYSLGE
ncbi:translation elongation factor Ts [Candidatus Dependentiae bacterium HGW-Dependentiae-1]|nr:MAG: translation elongation factor Ts [Candidatus Dependentiae bacterium HGW-Dependentiae-1]